MVGKNPYHKEIALMQYNIQYYRRMIALSKDPYRKRVYGNLLNREMMRLNHWNRYDQQTNDPGNLKNKRIGPNQREFTLEELAEYDGSGGRPAYIAVNGIVYDVSLEATWGGGTHFGLYAGRDLTKEFDGCHGGRLEVLRNLPEVGVLKS